MAANDLSFFIVKLWPCKDTFNTFFNGEVVAAAKKFIVVFCIFTVYYNHCFQP